MLCVIFTCRTAPEPGLDGWFRCAAGLRGGKPVEVGLLPVEVGLLGVPESPGGPAETRRRAPLSPLNRSRRGSEPISSRNTTDLDERAARTAGVGKRGRGEAGGAPPEPII